MRGDPSATTPLDPPGEIKILNLEPPGKMIKWNTEEVLRTIVAMNVLELIPRVAKCMISLTKKGQKLHLHCYSTSEALSWLVLKVLVSLMKI